MNDELNDKEKAQLLGSVDGHAPDDYDRDFYEAMYRTAPLTPEDLDDRVRRAIFRFISDGRGIASRPENGGLVLLGFAHGYMVGRKIRRDIRKKNTAKK